MADEAGISANEQAEVLANLMGGLDGLNSQHEEAPVINLRESLLYGNADYDGRESHPIERPAAPAPAPVSAPAPTLPPDVQRRLDAAEALERRAAEEDERRRTEAIAYAEQRAAQERAGWYQNAQQRAAQSAQVPEVDPDEILSSKEKLRNYGQTLVNQAVAAMSNLMQPAVAEHREAYARTAALVERAQTSAMQTAAAQIKQELGWDLTGAEQRELTAKLKSLGQDGEMLLSNPEQIVNTFILERRRSGKPLVAQRDPAPPPSLPARGSSRLPTGNVAFASLPQGAQKVLRTLGIRGGDITQDEMADLRAAGVL